MKYSFFSLLSYFDVHFSHLVFQKINVVPYFFKQYHLSHFRLILDAKYVCTHNIWRGTCVSPKSSKIQEKVWNFAFNRLRTQPINLVLKKSKKKLTMTSQGKKKINDHLTMTHYHNKHINITTITKCLNPTNFIFYLHTHFKLQPLPI